MNHRIENQELDCGRVLDNATLAYETWGSLNEDGDNAILVTHALTGSAHAASGCESNEAGWWEFLIGPGKTLDTTKYFVICINTLGGCSGSTGPSSIDERTGRRFKMSFPIVTIRDMVRSQKKIIDYLGVKQLNAVMGGSMGGMQALEWGALYPDHVDTVISFAAPGRAYPQSIAFRKSQRKAIMMDPDWLGGDYYDKAYPKNGIELARMMGVISYRSEEEFAQRFGRNHENGNIFDLTSRFEVEKYLEYQGQKLMDHFDPNTYLYLSKAMDLHDLGYGYRSYEEGVRRITCNLVMVGLSSDLLFPIHQQKEVVDILRMTNKNVRYEEIDTIHGHDAFLLEQEQINTLVRAALSSNKKEETMRFQTKLIHAGISPDPATGALITPIYQTTTFAFDDIGVNKGYDYSRTGNPTRRVLEENLAALEDGKHAVALPTGMSAETTILSLFKSGDHIICGNDVYGGTVRLFNYLSNHFGLNVTFSPMTQPEELISLIGTKTKAIWVETPSNPLLNVVDMEILSRIARKHNLLLIVDNTFLSPYFQQPLAWGADIVIHSTTKFLSGHNDGLGGAIICNDDELAEQLAFTANALGNAQGAFDSWLILRGIKTLALRMKEHEKNASKVAEFLSRHPGVTRVYYPGLESHPNQHIVRKQMTGCGGIVSFELKDGLEKANQVMRNTNLFYIAESFGGVESLIEHPKTMSHASMTAAEQQAAGMTDGLLRLSLGLEDWQDLIDDLSEALQ